MRWLFHFATYSIKGPIQNETSRDGPATTLSQVGHTSAEAGPPTVGIQKTRLNPAPQAAADGFPGFEIAATVFDTLSDLSFRAKSACATIPMMPPCASTIGMRRI
jgi:hypothetical protein